MEQKKIIPAFLWSLPIMLVSFLIIYLFPPVLTEPKIIIAKTITYILINSMFFMTMYTGKIDKYRNILFTSFAVSFPVELILKLFEERGDFMALTFGGIIHGEAPFCHIAVAQTFLPAIINREIYFPGTITPAANSISYTMGTVLFVWLAISLLIGRGWCSWTCFLGGWEDGVSRIKRKPKLTINPKYKLMPFAMLIVIMLASFVMITPAYCIWFCPFKSVTEFVEVASPLIIIQTVIFIVLFALLVIILPIMSKKRVQCSTFCPFGAFQSVMDKACAFDVKINKEKCIKCKLCIKECPMMAIEEKDLERGKTGWNCVKCGKCIDKCPKKAISFHIKGTPIGGISEKIANKIFLYFTYILVSAMGANFIYTALYRILLFITTGSFIHGGI